MSTAFLVLKYLENKKLLHLLKYLENKKLLQIIHYMPGTREHLKSCITHFDEIF